MYFQCEVHMRFDLKWKLVSQFMQTTYDEHEFDGFKLLQRPTVAPGAASQQFHDCVRHNPEVYLVEIECLRLNFLLTNSSH